MAGCHSRIFAAMAPTLRALFATLAAPSAFFPPPLLPGAVDAAGIAALPPPPFRPLAPPLPFPPPLPPLPPW